MEMGLSIVEQASNSEDIEIIFWSVNLCKDCMENIQCSNFQERESDIKEVINLAHVLCIRSIFLFYVHDFYCISIFI